MSTAGSAPAAAPPTGNLRAGAGRSPIVIPENLFPIDGFDAVHDTLQARVVVLDDGATRVALASVDQTSIIDESLSRMHEIIAHAAGTERENVVVAASHTFSAPHIVPASKAAGQAGTANDTLREAVHGAVGRAAAQAARTLRPARTGFGRGASNVNVNRDVRTADGWWLGADESGVSDKSVDVLRIEDLHGRPIAIVLVYAVQSSILNESRTRGGHRLVSADLAGSAARHVEEQYGRDAVAVFLTGAAGDQAPVLTAHRYTLDRQRRWSRTDVHEAGLVLVDLLGERLGAEAVRVSEDIRATGAAAPLRVVRAVVRVDAQVAPERTQDIQPTTAYAFRPAGMADVPITVLQVGEAVVVGVQAELCSSTGLGIKGKSPFEQTAVATVVDGAAKYMADARSYERITYEAMNSRYARGSAEVVATAVLSLLAELRA